MRQFKIYVILAANGIMIHPDYNRAVYCRDHFFRSPCIIKKYSTTYDAIVAAIDHLRSIAPPNREIPATIEINKFYHVSKLPKS